LSWDEASTDFYVTPEDIQFNPEEGCRLLHIHSDAFSMVPSQIVGQKLTDVCLTMTGQGFRYQKLSMSFIPAHSRSIQCSDLNTVDVHNIVNMKIVSWYHPLYHS
jgi:hypothetical protein